MENFKLGTQQALRFQTKVGQLSIEQLWQLSITDLDALAVSLQEEYEKSGKKSFLVKSSAKDKTTKLKFDIVLDILNTKIEEADALTEAREIKEHNKKILEVIAKKKDGALESKTIKQLEAELR